jgi:hypothetical protein
VSDAAWPLGTCVPGYLAGSIGASHLASSSIDRSSPRFVSIPAPELKDKLQSQTKQVDSDIDGLTKRLHYLETTAKNSQEHIEAMLRRGGA